MKGLHFEERKMAVIGFGISGKSVARHFLSEGIQVDVFEDKRREDFDRQVMDEFSGMPNFEIYFSDSGKAAAVEQYDYVVASPGVPLEHSIIAKAKQAGVEYVTDINLFLRLFRARYPYGTVISITGSNGKSTTVSLMLEALRAAGADAYLGGNIGTSPLDFFAEIKTEKPVIILETSSYQLEYMKPNDYFDIVGVTNISDNHLNRYGGSKELYAKAKLGGISKDKTTVILNLDDRETEKYVVPHVRAKKALAVQFEAGGETEAVTLEDNSIVYRDAHGESTVLLPDVRKLQVKGQHNVYNSAFVCAVFVSLGLPVTESAQEALYRFEGLQHRVQVLGTVDGITYINDSKSTTPDATVKALETLGADKDIILITGGNDKDVSYEPMKDAWETYVRGIVLLPGTADSKLKMLAERSGVELLAEVATMQEAFEVAKQAAREGSTVLLSPATDSHASFKSFEDRGNQFIRCVQELRSA